MNALWYRNAIVYQVDVSVYQDSNGDGWGDIPGLTARLPYLRGLGITCLWISPFYRSPMRDGGYDVVDHINVDARFGTLEDVVKLLEKAEELGIRVVIDLVAQHTSDQHPWFQAARKDRDSPYRDYYVWADQPEQTAAKPIFPTVEDDVWTWDDAAGQYYRHVFYRHEPDLNLANPAVRREIEDIMSFWLRLGVSGFRVDAAAHMIELARAAPDGGDGFWLMDELRRHASLRRADAVLLGEVDVPPQEYAHYFGDGHRLTMLSNFWLNNHLFLALARRRAEPIERALREQPAPPALAQYAVWVRNHDELDLERLSDAERDEVMRCFAPEPRMRIYNRGIRRRLPPMLGGDVQHIAQVQALLFSLPGTPILRYGEEIGMGEDLSLEERHAVRTAMQWSDEENGGFSGAAPAALQVPVIRAGPLRFATTNVNAQLLQPDSLLARVGRMLRTRVGMPEIGYGRWSILATDCPAVLALRYALDGRTTVTLVNLGAEAVECRIGELSGVALCDVFADRGYAPSPAGAACFALGGYGYRWMRRCEDR
ncbi:alpha-amylase family protein [Cupriavidus sp. MP-37]|uniref:alpha-amylase family protein n=1 Tax=Cupriavidus sp. MP-37 TaxID=2884455 RepID=UPI001D0AB5F0|nr:alpha-amylase family protein [Cupriavidus sp. MP-37]UDM48856.1 alpha-amylase family protein [Cupriavidus sp. MP-37]